MNVDRLPLDQLGDKVGVIDLFVCCVSYEERCLDIANAIASGLIRNAIVAENVNHASLHGRNLPKIIARFAGCMTHAATSTEDPIRTADALQAALRAYPNASRVVIDISTFTHEALLILLRLLATEARSAEYLYSAAGEYSVGDPPGQKWLSRGIREVRSILGYPGLMVPSRKSHLIILTGFEHERATELVRHYEPSVVSLGISTSQVGDGRHHEDAEQNALSSVRAFFPHSEEFAFDCFDPVGTADAIRTRMAATPDFNVVLASMNTKLSTLGAGLLAGADDRVQLCYAQAVLYNYLRYSKSNGLCYWVKNVPGPNDAVRRWGAQQKALADA